MKPIIDWQPHTLEQEQELQTTYSEKLGRDPFNWNAFLNDDNLSSIDWSDAVGRAGNWVTCACGNECSVIPRDDIGEPLDGKLAHSGMKFFRAIKARSAELALHQLRDIEERVSYLLSQPYYMASENRYPIRLAE